MSGGGPPATAWKIGRRAGACVRCSRPFEDGGAVGSTLVVGEGTLERQDRCPSCHAAEPQGPRDIRWRTKYRAAPKKARLDLAALAEVFKSDASAGELRYLVALLLLRHRKLRLVRTESREGRDLLVVAFGRSESTVDVEVSDLPPARMEEMRARLLALFDGGSA